MILRSPRFHVRMARLALVAILLMLTMPTVNRWLESARADVAPAVAMLHADAGMATGGMMMHGAAVDMHRASMAAHQHAPDAVMPMATHQHAADASQAPAPMPMPMPMGGPGDVCGYCPLLASLAPVLLILVILLPLRPCVPLAAWTSQVAHPLPLLRGLGARGPPIQL